MPLRKNYSANVERQIGSFWIGVQARCEAKEKGARKKTRKKKSSNKWWGNQVGAHDNSSYLQVVCIRRYYLSRIRDAGERKHGRSIRRCEH